MVASRTSTEDYVNDLISYLKRVHRFVDEQHRQHRERTQEAILRQLGPGHSIQIGDYVLFKENRTSEGISQRFTQRWRKDVFQVYDIIAGGPGVPVRSCILCDPSTGSRELGFSQPVSIDHVYPVELLPTARPTEQGLTRIKINDKYGTITNQCVDGRVYITFDGQQSPELFDLARTDYQWVYPSS